MIAEKIRRSIHYGKHTLHAAGEMLIQKENSHKKLVASCCMGVYTAFSPFIFLHTVMILMFGWFCGLNIPVMLAVSWFINNPWTMVPVYAFDCMVGNWVFSFVGIDSMQLNPQWMIGLNEFLASYIGLSGISFWSFMVGGNLFGIAISVMLYPIFSYFFTRIRG